MTTLLSHPVDKVDTLRPDHVAHERLVLCDLDGCLISEGQAFPEAAAFVEDCEERLWIVSNNSTHCADDLSADLARLGLSVPPDRILLAGEQTLYHLRDTVPNARLSVFGSDAIVAKADELGLSPRNTGPAIALLCRDPAFSLNRLDTLVAQVQAGAAFWVANLDTAHPGQGGQSIAETGALLAAAQAILGDVPVQSIGKPAAYMVEHALTAVGLPPSQAVFVGDNPATDGAAAKRAGIRFLLLDRAGGAS